MTSGCGCMESINTTFHYINLREEEVDTTNLYQLIFFSKVFIYFWYRGSRVHILNIAFVIRTDENPTYPPRDLLQERSALPGIIAAARLAFMKPYFFLITPHTESFEGVTANRSEFNPGKPFERQLYAVEMKTKSIISALAWTLVTNWQTWIEGLPIT